MCVCLEGSVCVCVWVSVCVHVSVLKEVYVCVGEFVRIYVCVCVSNVCVHDQCARPKQPSVQIHFHRRFPRRL